MHNLKNLKSTHGGVLLLVKLQASACHFTKSNTPHRVFFTPFKLYELFVKIVHNKATSEIFGRVLNTSLQSINHNITPLLPVVNYLYPLKTSENLLMFPGGIDKQHRAVMGLVEDLAKALGYGGETIHIQRHIQNPIKHLRWNILQKWFMNFSH